MIFLPVWTRLLRYFKISVVPHCRQEKYNSTISLCIEYIMGKCDVLC